MEPIFSDLTMLETLAEEIHSHQPHGRALAVTLDHIANNRGYFAPTFGFIRDAIESLTDQGKGYHSYELEKAFSAALNDADAFSKHLEETWKLWQNKIPLEDPGL